MAGAESSHVSGALAGFITEICLHPFDTVRARLQTSSRMYSGVCNALVTMQCKEGCRALYKGFPIVMALSSPAHALYFGTYETAKEYLPMVVPFFRYDTSSSAPPLSLSLTCGIVADMAGELLWTPCDVLKQRQQIQTSHVSQYHTLWGGASHIVRTEGPTAFWKGYWLGVATLESPLYFTIYEQMMHLSAVLGECKKDHLSLATVSVVSFWATALSALLTNPIDVLRTRMMVSSDRCRTFSHIRDLALHIWRREGAAAFVKGAPARMLYLAPNHCLSMTAFEFIRRQCHRSPLLDPLVAL
eukprot:EG_transcript_12820